MRVSNEEGNDKRNIIYFLNYENWGLYPYSALFNPAPHKKKSSANNCLYVYLCMDKKSQGCSVKLFVLLLLFFQQKEKFEKRGVHLYTSKLIC